MPSKTLRQHRAMAAAAQGNSTLGIPRRVGAEFVKADRAKQFDLPKGKKRGKKP